MPINFPTAGLVPNVTTYSYSGKNWLWNGNVWQSIGTTQGTTGPQGIQGNIGPTGIQGFGYAQLQGTQGATGIQGFGYAQLQGTQGATGTLSPYVTNAQTGTAYVLVIGDAYKIIEMNNINPNTITVPTNTNVPYDIGSQIIIIQTNSGQTTIAGDTGVTVNGTPGLKFRSQWSVVTLIKRGTNTWVATGDLSA